MIALLASKLPLVCVRDADCKHLKATHQVVVKLGKVQRKPKSETHLSSKLQLCLLKL